MALKFKCPKCGKEVVITVEFLKVGDIAKCRNCGAKVVIPADAIEIDEEPKSEKTEARTETRYDISERKKCPYCGGEVPDDAVKCGHCGSSLLKKKVRKGILISGLIILLFAIWWTVGIYPDYQRVQARIEFFTAGSIEEWQRALPGASDKTVRELKKASREKAIKSFPQPLGRED